ncbi:TIR domain-containing protein [Vitiosangium sp. GDMCC 1.1324]|uniref:TIR domain-containing protein n=1 Tax=Vitiosangium sp. (strain GDMCC 1.1324) TaxID=2138576 RepID=UPI000D390669|nr:TIR domain-containing protein [Vitiosangium sp. GDMCC 1.1324]PTL79972.1 hypothetical protein DAT35_31620 [Vitiosangium sp. GDMCC 1.1324]
MRSNQSPEPKWIYDAFISYSHAVDNQLAPAVQRCLHRLAKRWYRPRALRVFRDEGSLAANPDLWVTIESALRSSRYFILLASPEAARSEWVRREVSFWQEERERDTFLIALTEGEIHWDAKAGDFDWQRTTALPEQLRGAFDAEPLWVDLTWARTETQLSERHVRFRSSVGALAASVHGIPKDELDSEDIRQHRLATRLRWAAIAGLIALLVVALITARVALQQRSAAEQQRSVAEEQRKLAEQQRTVAEEQRRLATGRALLAEAENLRESQPQMSLRLNLAALRVNPTPLARVGLITNLMNTRYGGGFSSGDSSSDDSLSSLRDRIESAVFSPDARTLATVKNFSSKEVGVTLWDVTDSGLTRLADLSSKAESLEDVAFSADGGTLAIAARDGTVILWDLTERARPRQVATLTDLPDVSAVAFSPDGKTLATVCRPGKDKGAGDGSLILWHLGDRTRPQRLLTRTRVFDSEEVLFSPNGRLLLTSSGLLAGKESPTGLVVTHGTGQTLWDVSELTRPRELVRLPLSSEHPAFSPDSRLLVTAHDRNADLWDISAPSTPKRLAILVGHIDSLNAVAFSPDGGTLATASNDGTARLWNLRDPTRPSPVVLGGHTGSVQAVAFSPDGLTLSTADDRTTVTRWHTRHPEPTAVATLAEEEGVGDAAAFSPDSHTLATAGFGGTVLLWDVTDPRHASRLATLPGRISSVNAVSFSADGTTLGSAAGNEVNYSGQGAIVLWDVTAPEHPRKVATETRSTAVSTVAFSPRGTTLVATGGLVFSEAWGALWDVKDRTHPTPLITFSGINILGGIAFRPDGKVLALPQGYGLILWDISNPSRPVRISSESSPAHLSEPSLDNAKKAAFSPDGHSLATTHSDYGSGRRQGNVNLWDVTDPARPRHVATLKGHTGEINDIGYHPGGNLLATVSEDGTAILWDVAHAAAPNRVATLRMLSRNVQDLALSADGRWLVTSSRDRLAMVWDLGVLPAVVANPIGVACQLVGSGLSPEEWKQYVPGIPYQPLCQ